MSFEYVMPNSKVGLHSLVNMSKANQVRTVLKIMKIHNQTAKRSSYQKRDVFTSYKVTK